jgi:hypothetical protein
MVRHYANKFPINAVVLVYLSAVRFGSKADIRAAIGHVRFTPESGHVRCN